MVSLNYEKEIVYEITPNLKRYIKKSMAEKGLTFKELAKLNNISYSSLTKKLSDEERYIHADWFNKTFKPVGIEINIKTGRLRKVK